jgi:hypothetical protein
MTSMCSQCSCVTLNVERALPLGSGASERRSSSPHATLECQIEDASSLARLSSFQKDFPPPGSQVKFKVLFEKAKKAKERERER